MRQAASALAATCFAFLLWLVAVGPAEAAGEPLLPSGFRDTVLPLGGLEEPTAMRIAPDGKVFVAEKSGKVLVYDSLSDPTPTLFADLRTEVYNAQDRGLLGLAIDPRFTEGRPYVYVLYAYDHQLGEEAPPPRWGEAGEDGDYCPEPPGANTDGCVISGRLTRMTAEGDHAAEAEGEPLEDVLAEDWCQQFSSHSVGALQFDAEGNLWASGGEGGSFENVDYGQFGWPEPNPCGDPPAGFGGEELPETSEGGSLRAQNPKNLSGSVIRIDPETGEGVPGNPMYASLDQDERRIVGYGFRNPFRFVIDPASGEAYVGNVGSSIYEEIDRFAPSGTPYNSGWPCYEGPERRRPYEELGGCERLYEEPEATSSPFYYYVHRAGVTPEDPCPYEPGAAISGLAFYEGGSYPEAYDGALFFSDSVRGCIYAMRAGDDGKPDPSTVAPFLTEGGLYPGVDIETGPGGDLYYVSLFGEGYGPGAIHRISYDSDAPHAKLKAKTPTSGEVPLVVEFDAAESTDPQSEPLEYEWDLDGNGTFEAPTTEAVKSETYENPSENVTAAVRVVDEQAHKSIAQATVYPGDTPPVPEIEEPSEALEWSVGQEIEFAGSATDSEEVEASNPSGTVPLERLYWRSRLYHCPEACHAHPLEVFPGVTSGTLIAPDHDLPSHIELSLTATDARGLSATKTVDIYPRTVTLSLESSPPGVTLSAGLEVEPAPFTLEAIKGSRVQLSAPQTAEPLYRWDHWSDGGERIHTAVADEATTYEAVYTSIEPPPLPGPKESQSQAEDTEPPQTWLRAHPPKRTASRTARFAFRSSEAGSTFRCQLDRTGYRACRSPKKFRGLKPGKHLFRVYAIDAAGNRDGSAAHFAWKVGCRRGRKRHLHHHAHRRPAATSSRRATRRRAGCAR